MKDEKISPAAVTLCEENVLLQFMLLARAGIQGMHWWEGDPSIHASSMNMHPQDPLRKTFSSYFCFLHELASTGCTEENIPFLFMLRARTDIHRMLRRGCSPPIPALSMNWHPSNALRMSASFRQGCMIYPAEWNVHNFRHDLVSTLTNCPPYDQNMSL